MKPRSTVSALLAVTESLLAARAAKVARTKRAAAKPVRVSKIISFLFGSRPLVLRIKQPAIS